ncbi:MAG: hypothetical protein AAGD28_14225 [Bacteroidota bacterium]
MQKIIEEIMGIRLSRVFLSLLVVSLISISCKSSKTGVVSEQTQTETPDPDLLSFDKGTVSQEEFERVYAKNNGGREAVASHTAEQYREYLDLYVKFKRKVFEAEDLGLDDTPGFKFLFESRRIIQA